MTGSKLNIVSKENFPLDPSIPVALHWKMKKNADFCFLLKCSEVMLQINLLKQY